MHASNRSGTVLDSDMERVSTRSGIFGFGASWFNPGLTISGLTKLALWLVYAVAVGITVAHHEPWADEAQAWLIAKNLPFWKMLLGQVRYEGTPGLWHSSLWVLSHIGLPYGSMLWFSWTAAVCSTWFFLTYSPFPLFLRALIPFTFYLCYQFAVVSRSYVLMPLLVFAAVHLIRIKSTRILLFGLIAGLLANCNVFGLFISFGLALVYLWQVRHSLRGKALRDLLYKGVLPYGLLAALAVATAAPPKDMRFLSSTLGEMLNKHTGPDDPSHPPIRLDGVILKQHLLDYVAPLSHSFWFAMVTLGVVIWQAGTHRFPIALLPAAFLILSLELVYKAPRHMGLFPLMLFAVLWLVWPDRETPVLQYRIADLLCSGVFVLICIPQIAWSVRAVHFDFTQNYSGSRACADFLRKNSAGLTVFGYDYFTVAVTAYFDGPIFRNQSAEFWPWSTTNTTDLRLDRIVSERPEYVVLAWNENATFGYKISTTLSPPVDRMQQYIRATGYKPVALFTGSQVMRNFFSERDFFQVFRRPALTPRQWELLEFRLDDPPGIQP